MSRSLVIVMCCVAPVALAQVAPSGQSAQNAELTRALDRATTAFSNARQDAADGDAAALRASLNKANEAWADCYGRYREWPTNDAGWRRDFDAINNALMNAVNALTPGKSVPGAKAQIDFAVSTLNGLRSRNGITDIRGALEKLQTDTEALQKTIAGLHAGQLTAADISALKTSFQSFRDSWVLFTQAAIDVNAFGLEPGKLEDLEQIILLVNIGIDGINNILRNPNTSNLISQWQDVRSRTLALIQQLQPAAEALPTDSPDLPMVEDRGGAPESKSESAGPGGLRQRPRLLPPPRR